MASPDVAAYVGLELVDITAQGLINQALIDAATKFPGWTPREGNTEVVILELLAALAEEEVYALERVPDGVTERLLLLLGIPRDLGAAATATITFTAVNTAGYTIPAGTVVRALASAAEPVDLTTNVALVIAPGATTGTVAATVIGTGSRHNGIPAATALEVIDSLSGIQSATLATATAGGRTAEDGVAYLRRTVPALSAFTTTLVRPQDVEAYVAANYPAVVRVKALDRYNPAAAGIPGDHPGYVTVAVRGTAGAALTAPTRTTIRADLVARMHSGLIVDVVDATVTTVNVAVTVLARPGAVAATVQAKVAEQISAYLNPDTWAWSSLVRRNEIIAAADLAAGVDTVLSVSTPATDLVLEGAAPIAQVGTVTVTVQAP